MNKKILFGSIIAVVILVLVSFTGVVGYRTTSTTIAKASPLFSVRSSRAIDEESKDLTCDYVGKGEVNFLSIPKRNERGELVQKIINMISKMDEKEVHRFLDLIVRKLFEKNMITNENIPEVEKLLFNSKSNLSAFNNGLIIEKKDAFFTKFQCLTSDCYTVFDWAGPICWMIIILAILVPWLAPLYIILRIFNIKIDIPLTIVFCD